jgi:ketosteroid isomerase-like protein
MCLKPWSQLAFRRRRESRRYLLAPCTRSACTQILLLCGLSACLPIRPNPQGGAEQRADVLAANARWDAASVARDPDALNELMADDFTHINFNGSVATKATIIPSLRANRGFGYREHRSDSVAVRIYGNTAVMTGILIRRGDVGRPQDDGVFRFTRVWTRSATGWRAALNQFTLIPDRK